MSAQDWVKKTYENWMKKNNARSPSLGKVKKFEKQKVIKSDQKQKEEIIEYDDEPDVEKPEEILRKRVIVVLEQCKEKFPQYDINGCHNIWILKPAGLSRG